MIVENYYWLDYLSADWGSQVQNPPAEKDTRAPNGKTILDDRFEPEVKLLLEFMGLDVLTEGTKISLTLQEILKVVPRKRSRVDSYNTLVRYLKEQYGVELIITSNKSKSTKNGKKVL